MAKEIKIPQISEGVETATVAEVLVSKGDTVEEEQGILVLDSDKASVEVPCPISGTIKSIKVKEGDEVKVGQVVATVEETDADGEEKAEEPEKVEKEQSEEDEKEQSEDAEEVEDTKNQEEESEGEADKKGEKKKKVKEEKSKKNEASSKEKKAEEGEENEAASGSKEKSQDDASGVQASPGVRRLARELGVDIKEVAQEVEGRISEKDIKSFSKKDSANKPATSATALPDFSKWGSTERQPLSGIRKSTAQNVTRSWKEIPHVFQFDEADITEIDAYLQKHQKDVKEDGVKLSITALLTKIVAGALRQFPKFNASIDMENKEMVLKNYININIAVATEKGLLVPVIRDADRKTIVEIAVEIDNLAEKARKGKLTSEEMQGGNFSISNLGGIGGTSFTPIVNYPQVAILGISKAQTKPVYRNNKELEARQILPLSLSYDHRMIDGAEGASFINWIAQALADPYKALLGA